MIVRFIVTANILCIKERHIHKSNHKDIKQRKNEKRRVQSFFNK